MIRSQRMVEVAARAAESLFRQASIVRENYFPEQEELVLTREDVVREMQERGHIPPDPTCSSDICAKARLMIQNALAQVTQEQV